jgi:hypothetical protein
LDSDGLWIFFHFNYPSNFTRETYRKFFDFFIGEAERISGILLQSGLRYRFGYIDIFSVTEDLRIKFDNEDYDVFFHSVPTEYPIDYKKINAIIYSNILLFPIINSCIEIALGNEPEFERDIKTLSDNIDSYINKYILCQEEEEQKNYSEEQIEEFKARADSKVKVLAGVRWQVFKRDNWRCVACGRSAGDDVVLHVDHIIPRSKGGKDEIRNYQTLCDKCNIGKSNKDDTDLRINLEKYDGASN